MSATTPEGSVFVASLRSEWTKLRSVPATVWSLLVTALFTIGLGTLFCELYLHRRADRPGRLGGVFDPTDRSLRGIFLAQLSIGVLGVLVMTSEHTSGMIRSTFAAVPRRGVVLATKAIVLGVVSLVIGVGSTFIAFLAGQAILHSQHLGASFSQTGVLRAVLLAGVYLAMIASFGLAIGAIVRRTPGAIAALFGIVLILPFLAQGLPSPWDVRIGKLLPFNAGQAMFQVRHDPDVLSPGKGFLAFLVWIVVAYVVAAVAMIKRDV
jgi:hypothetical protein